MNQMFRCGDEEALVASLYEDGDAAERAAVAAHVAHCASCAEELEALRATRGMLAAWAPPQAALGFQITRGEERPTDSPATVLRPAAWWRRPLPAWAQAAAAVLIFAAGMAAGTARDTAVPQAPQPAAGEAQPVVTTAAVSVADLARLEARMRSVETSLLAARENVARVQTPVAGRAAPSPTALDEQAVLRRVEAMIATSELQQLEVMERLAQEMQVQRSDLRKVGNRVERLSGATVDVLREQTEAMNSLVQGVSYQPRPVVVR